MPSMKVARLYDSTDIRFEDDPIPGRAGRGISEDPDVRDLLGRCHGLVYEEKGPTGVWA